MTTVSMRGELDAITSFLERHGEDVGEVAWATALGWLEHAVSRAREGRHGRWGMNPSGELRRLRFEVSRALTIARFAAGVQQLENERRRDLTRELQDELAERAAGERRRAASREAARVKQVRRRARLEGREPTFEELYPALDARRRPQGST